MFSSFAVRSAPSWGLLKSTLSLVTSSKHIRTGSSPGKALPPGFVYLGRAPKPTRNEPRRPTRPIPSLLDVTERPRVLETSPRRDFWILPNVRERRHVATFRGQCGQGMLVILDFRLLEDISSVVMRSNQLYRTETTQWYYPKDVCRVLSYPFTVMYPSRNGNLQQDGDYRRVFVCDIEGVEEGPHVNVSPCMKHRFFRNVERAQRTVIAVDAREFVLSSPYAHDKCIDFLTALCMGLRTHHWELLELPAVLFVNSTDMQSSPKSVNNFWQSVLRQSRRFDRPRAPHLFNFRDMVALPLRRDERNGRKIRDTSLRTKIESIVSSRAIVRLPDSSS